MHSTMRRLTVTAICLAVVGVGIGACDGEEDAAAPRGQPQAAAKAASREVTLPRGVSARLPAGWQLLRKPITGVIYPVQVLAAASYPAELGERPPGCHPGHLLDQKPAEGVLVEVIEYTRQPNLVDRMPPRETPFRLPRSAYANYGCTGLSYNIAFRDHGRALQAFVVLDRKRVDRRVRRQTIELLSSMRFDRESGRHMCPKGSAAGGYDADRLEERWLMRARRIARGHGCTVRVVKRDGEFLAVSDDLRRDRINVAIEGGRITRVFGVF